MLPSWLTPPSEHRWFKNYFIRSFNRLIYLPSLKLTSILKITIVSKQILWVFVKAKTKRDQRALGLCSTICFVVLITSLVRNILTLNHKQFQVRISGMEPEKSAFLTCSPGDYYIDCSLSSHCPLDCYFCWHHLSILSTNLF